MSASNHLCADISLEYVHWENHGAAGDSYALFENGYQPVLDWRF